MGRPRNKQSGPSKRISLRRNATLYEIERSVGGTRFIVTGEYSATARETAPDKVRRLILNDLAHGRDP